MTDKCPCCGQAINGVTIGSNRKTGSISTRDKWALMYLAKADRPVWGGHLSRGEPANYEIQNWLERGLIQQVGDQGYVLTEFGRSAISWAASN